MYITMTVRAEDGVVSNTFETDTTKKFASLLSLTKTMSGMHDFSFSSVNTEPF